MQSPGNCHAASCSNWEVSPDLDLEVPARHDQIGVGLIVQAGLLQLSEADKLQRNVGALPGPWWAKAGILWSNC